MKRKPPIPKKNGCRAVVTTGGRRFPCLHPFHDARTAHMFYTKTSGYRFARREERR